MVTTIRLKAPSHLVVHDNLKTFTNYSERSVQKPIGLASVKCTLRSRTLYNLENFIFANMTPTIINKGLKKIKK